MRNTIFTFFLLAFVASCDAPQTIREEQMQYSNSSGSMDYTGNYSDNQGSGNDNDYTDQTDTDPSTDVTSTPGFENCDLGIQYNGGSIGNFGICQNSQQEAQFKAIFANSAAPTDGTCFVPVHISGTTSFKLGIAECVRNTADTPYDIPLTKQRPEAINGVMVIKASSLNSYMQCMNAKANYINSQPGCAYNQACITAATNYANQVCSSFVSYHSNNYKQIQF
jgi:hypothetical protein